MTTAKNKIGAPASGYSRFFASAAALTIGACVASGDDCEATASCVQDASVRENDDDDDDEQRGEDDDRNDEDDKDDENVLSDAALRCADEDCADASWTPRDDAGASVLDGGGSDAPPPPSAICGNQLLDLGEECDDGKRFNTGMYGGCNEDCTKAPFCGDGIVSDGETCDPEAPGNSELTSQCTETCGLKPRCGDGIRTQDEECDLGDEGNDGAYGGCTEDCKQAPRCGDAEVDPSEQCDLGDGNNTGEYGGCYSNCKHAPYCGDGFLTSPEECDNGTANNDGRYGGCKSDCTKAPQCDPNSANNTACGNQCVNLASNVDHCGQCGNDCAPNYACEQGVCKIICVGTTRCTNDLCVDTLNDPSYCGGCNATPCAEPNASGDAVCNAGICGIDCDPGFDLCSGNCYDLDTNENHCGTCGNDCETPANGTALCTDGDCGFLCDQNYTECAGACKNLQADSDHCGTCGNDCQAPANATVACVNGDCAVTCNSPLRLCSGQCFNTSNDANHCGGCNACPIVPDATRKCTNSTCGHTCAGRPLACETPRGTNCGEFSFNGGTIPAGWSKTDYFQSDASTGPLETSFYETLRTIAVGINTAGFPKDAVTVRAELCASPTGLEEATLSMRFAFQAIAGSTQLNNGGALIYVALHSAGTQVASLTDVINFSQGSLVERTLNIPAVAFTEIRITPVFSLSGWKGYFHLDYVNIVRP
jgi:hypothetical protein